MDTWVMQKGYPVISVKWHENQITLNQRRFLSSPPESDTAQKSDISPFGYKWIVPITLISSKKPFSSQLFWFNTTDMIIPLDESNKWFKLNVNQSGFYRVNYEPSIWNSLIDLMMESKFYQHILSSTDRANLIDDAFALMKIGLLRVDLALKLTLYLENGERDYVPWETAIYHFGILDTLMLQNPLLQKYICKLIEPLITIWGWKDHSFDLMLVRKLRALLLRAAVSYGDKQSQQMAMRYFQSWMTNNTKIPANLREVVYNTGIQLGGRREWNFCWDKYSNSSVPSEKKLLLGALGATRNAWLLSQYLNYSLDKTKIKTQDTVHVINVVSRNPLGKEMVWKFVRQNWNQIINLFGQGSFSMDSIITETTWHFMTRFEYNEVQDFFKSVSVGSGIQSVEQSLEKIRANIYWKDNIENSVIEWLKKNSND
jgi:glutamyl aminopeptidase